MSNIHNYIRQYKDISLDEKALTQLDMLALTELSYVAMPEVVSSEFDSAKAVPIKDIFAYYTDHKNKLNYNYIMLKLNFIII